MSNESHSNTNMMLKHKIFSIPIATMDETATITNPTSQAVDNANQIVCFILIYVPY